MNRKTILTCVLALFACVNIYADDFGTWFYNKTMRFDYYHAGSATTEYLFFDEIIEEPYYAGSKTNLIDDFGYGNYRFSLYDKASGKLIYRRGYDNLMKEWRTIPEAEIFSKAMPESIVFPYPRKEVKLVIEARDRRNVFHELYTYDIDPESYFIRKSQPSLQTMEIAYQGNSDHCVDLVLIPEGYTEADKALFEEDCHKFADYLFSYAPYGDNKGRFNVRAVWAPSQDAGVSIPGENVWRNTACKVQYYTFDSERYQMTMDMQNLRDIAGNAPYEYIYIISNSQKYGGGAIYNWYGISAAHIFSRPESVRKTYAHEFGHLLLGLGDEYVGGSETALYDLDVEPWEANLTILPGGKAKWQDMIERKTPVPTPIAKDYDRDQVHQMNEWKLGAYEGGGYLDKGIYRPMPNCMMNWMHTQDEFCPVCDKSIREYIDFLTGRPRRK